MFSFRNLQISSKLALLIVIASVGLATFAAYTFYTLGVVRVNGPIYQGLAQNQELVADILPPPSYIIESYLTASQILDAATDNDTASVNTLIDKAAALQKDYETRHAYWTETLASSADKETSRTLLINSYQPAETYFQAFNDQFLPAIQSGKIETGRTILRDQLKPAYEAHRAAIDKVVTLQNAEIKVNEADAQALLERSTTLLILLAILTTGLIIGLGIFISRSITTPVGELTRIAKQVASGELDARAPSDTKDEVGVLAGAFNSMTSQLRNLISSLEQRVAERTHNLELAAEVGRSLSRVRALDDTLKNAVEFIRSQFDLYHVQVYLTNPAQNLLLLQASTGTIGAELMKQGHNLPLDTTSINGRAAVEKHSLVVSDTSVNDDTLSLYFLSRSKQVKKKDVSDASASFRPNPLLPDTLSELAIPLIVDEKVVGVLDLQNNKVELLKPG